MAVGRLRKLRLGGVHEDGLFGVLPGWVDGSTTSTIARQQELHLPLLLDLLNNQSSNHEQMDMFHLLLG